ncbi:phosphoadenosine phosphosulfate reductase family protein [Clostridium perfringens]|uniref:phosphoadenosine phosphosulfate reductase domain-containing protein n=1 Tax=Clostridium perfringens TaxID=1502 RepID=UPI00096A44D3|nr:phosphoadenosine phosphosulfate reductase family protein [Clostridium perfringens]
MKPIFEQEKVFFENKSGINLPENCWMDGQKIYLNCDDPFAIITFKVDTLNDKIIIKKNMINNINGNKIHIKGKYKNRKYDEIWINLTLNEEIEKHSDRLNTLEEQSIIETMCCIQYHKDHEFRLSDSSGKDSAVCSHIYKKAMKRLNRCDYDLDFFNTTNDTADTYLNIKKNMREHCEFILEILLDRKPTLKEVKELYREKEFEWIHNPQKGWYRWLEEDKNYLLPSIMMRNCCSTYKEGELKKLLDKNKKYVLFLGMRKYESSKRADYDWYLNDAINEMYLQTKKDKYKLNVPKNWIRFLPIVEWENKDIWLYMIKENIRFNEQYLKGFSRIGCLICPYASDYNHILTKYWYPRFQKRWDNVVEKNYDIWRVNKRLKWSLEEWQSGKWKAATSKPQELIQKKATPERVKELSEMLGISEELARKYFKKECSCGSKLNPSEVGMFLKLFGRYEGLEDTRQYLCKKCMCKELGWTTDYYKEKYIGFSEQGCNLF